MKCDKQRIIGMAAGLIGALIVAGAAGCAHSGWAEVDVMGNDGYNHHGYYDDHHDWHGGWYDGDHRYHEDPRDWHH